jgi:hypothetical protein
MKPALGARILFGASAVLFGAITLIWHDADTWQGLPILKLPFGAIVGDGLAIAQIVGGIALMYPRTIRAAAIVLGTVYAIFVVACIPGIVAEPKVYVHYGGLFEWFSLVSGALAAYGLVNIARLGLGISTISFTLAQIVYFRFTASLVPLWILPNQQFWAIFTTISFALAAIAILINRYAVLAIRLMTLMLALFGLLVWVPMVAGHPGVHGNWSEFALNFLITGAAWMVGTALERNAYAAFESGRE